MSSPSPYQEALQQLNTANWEISQLLKSLDASPITDPFKSKSGKPLPAALKMQRKRLADAAARLHQLATPPEEYIEQLSANNQHMVSLRWLINLDVLSHVPEQGSISYGELASKAGVPEGQLKSVARMAIAHGFLQETSDTSVTHSPTSYLIATDPSFNNWARFFTNYSVPSAYYFPDATQKFGHTEKKNETSFNINMNVQVPFFDYMKQDDKMRNMFASYMRNVASAEGTSFEHLISGYDWKKLPEGSTIIDVGGSKGHASVSLAQRFPSLKFKVQDLPDTIKGAEEDLAKSSPDLKDRISFHPHDFFTTQDIRDGDVYLLRMILHDWPESEAVKILSHLREGLTKPNARIVVMDTILPRPGTTSLLQERQLRVRDLTMMQIFNAKERELEDWEQLVGKAGLKVINVRQPDRSNMGLLELGLAGPQPISSAINGAATNGHTTALTNGHSAPVQNGSTNGAAPAVNGSQVAASSRLGSGNKESPLLAAPSRNDLPVLIIGAGISGLCLGQFLRKHNVPFLIFERDLKIDYRPQGYRLKLEGDAAEALRESLIPELFRAFEASCANSYIGETDFNPLSGECVKSRAGGGLAGRQGLRATHTVDRTVFRSILASGIEDKIQWGRSFASYKENEQEGSVTITFQDSSTAEGRFIAGADGVRSLIRKQFAAHHKYVDTGATCIYGKTPVTAELLEKTPKKAFRWMTVATDGAPLIQSILIGDSPLTLLSEPINFSDESRSRTPTALPADYIYWVLIGRKELFTDATDPAAVQGAKDAIASDGTTSKYFEAAAKASAEQSIALTSEWHPSLRALFELQDVRQASTLPVVSASPKIPDWEPSRFVTLIGDAVHAMSPCGGVGANTALRDAAELGKVFAGEPSTAGEVLGRVAAFEGVLRKRAFGSLMRSYVGSKAMFDQKPFEQLAIVDV